MFYVEFLSYFWLIVIFFEMQSLARNLVYSFYHFDLHWHVFICNLGEDVLSGFHFVFLSICIHLLLIAMWVWLIISLVAMLDSVRNMVGIVHVWYGILEETQLFCVLFCCRLHLLLIDSIVTSNCLVVSCYDAFHEKLNCTSHFLCGISLYQRNLPFGIDIFHSFCLYWM